MKRTMNKSGKNQSRFDNISNRTEYSMQHKKIHQNCLAILHNESEDEISKWLVENKIASFAIKTEKSVQIIVVADHILREMVLIRGGGDEIIGQLISYYRGNQKKIYEYCRILRHYATKDNQFQYVLSTLKNQNNEPISFYLKCRLHIIESYLNKQRKDLMMNVIGNIEQWFKIVKSIFKTLKEEQAIELYTETIKEHYVSIKKNQNEEMSGSEIFKVCQIIYRREKKNESSFANVEKPEEFYQQSLLQIKYFEQQQDYVNTPIFKEREIKRLFDKHMVQELEVEDRELIRMLSYKDDNIARLLEQKHEKMIEMIAGEVDEMRKNIECEREKYIRLSQQMKEMNEASNRINILALHYMTDESLDNEDKLFQAIENYTLKFNRDSSISHESLLKIKEKRMNKRLIEIIEKEEKELD